MADNTTLNSGSGGDVISTDDIAGVKVQRVKVQYGVDGAATDVSDTNPMPVDDAGGSLTVDNAALSVTGGGVEASALRVTLASDSTGVVSVDDNGGSLTIDNADITTIAGAVSGTEMQVDLVSANVTNAGTFAVQVDGSALTALQTIDNPVFADDAAFTLASSSVNMAGAIRDDTLSTLTAIEGDAVPLRVSSTGALHVTGSSGSTQYAEDSVHSTGDTGTMALAVRNDTLAALAGTDGDYAPLQVDASGAMYVSVTSFPNGQTDDAAFTPATDQVSMIGCTFDDTTPDSVDEGDGGAVRMSANRNMYVTLRDAAGNERGLNVDASGNITANLGTANVTNAGTFATQVDGAALTALQLIDDPVFADDAAFTLASSKVSMAGAIRDDSLTTLTAIEGDAVPLRVSSTGALHVTGAGGGTQYSIDDAAPTVVTMAGVVRDDSLTTLTEVDGDATVLRVNSTGALHVTGGGGGTEYNEDDATPATIVGTATMMERDDALSTLTPIEGDWVGMRATAEGALWTQDFNSDASLSLLGTIDADTGTLAGAVSGGQMQVNIVTDSADLLTNTNFAAAFGTAGTADAQVMSVQGIASMTPILVDATGQGDVPITLGGETVVLGAGSAAIGKLAANSGVDIGDVDVTSVVPGTGASNLGKAEDAAHTSGDVGVMALAVRQDTVAALAGTTGDYIPLTTNPQGFVRATAGGASAYRNIDANAEAAIKASAGTLHWIHAMNMTAAVAYLHLYNATTATVTPGTTTPTFTFPIPTLGDTNGAGFNLRIDQYFSTAITLVVTTTLDGSTGDPGTNGVIVNAGYT